MIVKLLRRLIRSELFTITGSLGSIACEIFVTDLTQWHARRVGIAAMIAEPNLKALIALTKNGVSSTCIGDGVPTDDIDCTQAALMSFSTDAINLHRSRIKILMELGTVYISSDSYQLPLTTNNTVGTLSLIVGSSIIAFPDHKCIRSKKQQWKVYFYWVLDTRTCASACLLQINSLSPPHHHKLLIPWCRAS